MAHSADEIAVCGGYRALALGKYAHISAKTRTAGRSRHDCACLDEIFKIAFFHRLKINLLGCGNHDAAYIFRNLFAFDDFGGCGDIFKSAVCARADYNLVYLDILGQIFDNMGVFGQMWERNGRLDFRQINNVCFVIFCVGVSLVNCRLLAARIFYVFDSLIVNLKNTVFSACLNRHIRHAESICDRQRMNALADKLH